MNVVKGIPMVGVNSSNIKELGHDAKTNTMQVNFHNGAEFQYHPVTEEFYKELLSADSVGAHFNKHVKTNTAIEYKQIKEKNPK